MCSQITFDFHAWNTIPQAIGRFLVLFNARLVLHADTTRV